LDHDFHGVVAGGTDQFQTITQTYHVLGLTSLKLMKQRTGTLPMSFFVPRDSFLIEPYNEAIRRLRDGITEYWINFYLRKGEKLEDLGPEVLDMEQLAVGFYVCMIPLALAVITFFFELLWNHFEKLCGRYKEKFKTFKDCNKKPDKKFLPKLKSCYKQKHKIIMVKPIKSTTDLKQNYESGSKAQSVVPL
jgi:hypothetical protein